MMSVPHNDPSLDDTGPPSSSSPDPSMDSTNPSPPPHTYKLTYAQGLQQLFRDVAPYEAAALCTDAKYAHVIRDIPHSKPLREHIRCLFSDLAVIIAQFPEVAETGIKLLCILPAMLLSSGSRTETINQIIKQIYTGNPDNLVLQTVERCTQEREKARLLRQPRDLTDTARAVMASKLIAAEELGRAGQVLNGEFSVAPHTDENVQRWKALHPQVDPLTTREAQVLLDGQTSSWRHRKNDRDSPFHPNPGEVTDDMYNGPLSPSPCAGNPPQRLVGNGAARRTRNSACRIEFLPRIDTLSNTIVLDTTYCPVFVDDAKAQQSLTTAAHQSHRKSSAGPFGMSIALLQVILRKTRAQQRESANAPAAKTHEDIMAMARLILWFGEGYGPEWFHTHVFNVSKAIFLSKPAKPIRPIGVGYGFRRVYSRYMLTLYRPEIINSLPHGQMGMDRKGAETLVHFHRRILRPTESTPTPASLAAAPVGFFCDMQNAFNTISRKYFLGLVDKHWPGHLARYIRSLYGSHNMLFIADNIWHAHVGVTQGCIFGPPVYSLATAQALLAARIPRQAPSGNLATFATGYLDDTSNIGQLRESVDGVTRFIEASRHTGSVFNSLKSEFYTPSQPLYEMLLLGASSEEGAFTNLTIPGEEGSEGVTVQVGLHERKPCIHICTVHFTILPPAGVQILGAPVGTPSYGQASCQRFLDKAQPMFCRIAKMRDVQCAIVALRTLVLSKFVHMARTSPPADGVGEAVDCLTTDTVRALIQGSPDADETHFKTLIGLRTEHGGVGLQPLALLWRDMYTCSLLGALPCLSRVSTTLSSVHDALLIPPSSPAFAQGIAQVSHPDVAMLEFGRSLFSQTVAQDSVLTETHLRRLLGIHPHRELPPITWPALCGQLGTLKLQWLSSVITSHRRRETLCDETRRRISERDPRVKSIARRRLRHLQANWSRYYQLVPWIRPFHIPGACFASAMRYHLCVESTYSRSLGLTMSCNCTGGADTSPVPREYHHAYTCNFNTSKRIYWHDAISVLTRNLVSKGPFFDSLDVAAPTVAPTAGGTVPDLLLHAKPGAAPSEEVWGKFVDITTTSVFQLHDLTVGARNSGWGGRDNPHLDRAYDAKVSKHLPTYGNEVVPLVFGMSGQLASRSDKWLHVVTGPALKPQRRFYLLHCTALICRMVSALEQATLLRRYRLLTSSRHTAGPVNTVPSPLPIGADDLAEFHEVVVSNHNNNNNNTE